MRGAKTEASLAKRNAVCNAEPTPLGRKRDAARTVRTDKRTVRTDKRTIGRPADDRGDASALLQETPRLGFDELYSDDEQRLNTFVSGQTILSMELTKLPVLQLIAGMCERAHVATRDVPVLGKSYDDTFLRPPNTDIGERACVCGESCMCIQMARLRYGPETDLAFVGVEFLLPEEQRTFIGSGTLPTRRKKCLVCARYYQHYMYVRARADPTFRLDTHGVSVQAFCNSIGHENVSDPTRVSESLEHLPHSASIVHADDGYRMDAMLFVDETYAQQSVAARVGGLSVMTWKPVVKFNSGHYNYVRTGDGVRIVQVGVAAKEPPINSDADNAAGFGMPPSERVRPAEA